jgi:hypothetical protein
MMITTMMSPPHNRGERVGVHLAGASWLADPVP